MPREVDGVGVGEADRVLLLTRAHRVALEAGVAFSVTAIGAAVMGWLIAGDPWAVLVTAVVAVYAVGKAVGAFARGVEVGRALRAALGEGGRRL